MSTSTTRSPQEPPEGDNRRPEGLGARKKRRIDELAIPPAWRDVWICARPNGHIQAVGTESTVDGVIATAAGDGVVAVATIQADVGSGGNDTDGHARADRIEIAVVERIFQHQTRSTERGHQPIRSDGGRALANLAVVHIQNKARATSQ